MVVQDGRYTQPAATICVVGAAVAALRMPHSSIHDYSKIVLACMRIHMHTSNVLNIESTCW